MAVPNKNKIKAQPPATVQNFAIVAIGASAGGLDAYKLLVTAIPENSGMAYVLVQHLDPSHESILPEILQRLTKIPVHEITEDIHLAPNHIYVIPSNKILTSTDGVLQMKVRNKKIINYCIDTFFTSLAVVHKEFAVGIVLSGTGSDGTLGLKAIKEHGGICIAQDPQSAAYDNMPKSAIDAGVVDYILAPGKIPAHLKQIVPGHLSKAEKELPTNDRDIFNQILLLLRQRSGVDFTNYKEPTFHRRIARRIAVVKKKNLADYLNFLRSDNAEQDALFQDVLIPVTSFFRDPKTFQTLTETVFPALFKNKAADLSRGMDIQLDESRGMDIQLDEPIRVWIAGCSTGEEAFSIAICLHEYLTLNLSKKEGDYFNPYVGGRGAIQIFASDISEKAIKKARAAIFKEADVAMLSAVQLKNYFVKNIGGYKVNKIIRDMCVFAQHNFLKDPPFAKMDLITCRNVLIYMDSFLQKKAFTNFHYALKENGFLLLGKSETIGASASLFTQVSRQDKIYLRKPTQGRFMPLVTDRREAAIPATGKSLVKHETVYTDFRKRAEEIMILKSPASVVVNEAMDIVHIYGDITPFLQAPQGKATHNVIKMAREGLAFELRNAFQKVIKEQATVITENVLVKASALSDPNSLRDGQGKHSLVTAEIIPLADTNETHYLIRFEKKTIPVVQEKEKSSSGKIIESSRKLLAHNQQLEKELLQTRDYMLSITEEMETANEELQSGNEELQSSNEEMQSLNEELQTSKEELQSSNEELIIVNQELLDKQEQLNVSYSEQVNARKQIEASEKRFSNILSQSLMAIAILKGPEMIVVSANETIIAIWGKGENVIGKPLTEVLPEIKVQVFPKLLMDVYTTGVHFVTNEIKCILNRNGKEQECYFNLVYQPYRDVDDTITGITLLATEITEYVFAKKQIEESEQRFRNLILQAPVLIATFKGPSFIIETVNKSVIEAWGKSYEELINKPFFEVSPELEEGLKTILNDIYITGEPFINNEIAVQLKRPGKPDLAYFNLLYKPLRDLNNKIHAIILIGTEVTETVNARKRIEESEREQKKLAMQLKLATDSAKVGIWSLDIVSSKLEWSNIHKKMWGYEEHRENLTYEDWHKLILPEDKELAFSKIEESKVNHEIYDVEYRISRANDGAIVWMKSSGQYYYDQSGKAHTLTGISTDITEQKGFTTELEIRVMERTAELQNANEELKQTNLQLDQFAHIASHDLQEPLRKIITFSMRLQDMHKAELSTEVKSYLNKIEIASSRMSTLVSDLLNFSRLLQYEKLFMPTDLNGTIANILDDFELLVLEKEAQIKFDKLPTIDAIPLQMNQLFYNLIINALKFSKKDVPPVITITSRTLTKKEIQQYPAFNPFISYVEIIFKDNGIGFEQQYAGKIFIIFQRLHDKETYKGTGIGLALTKKIIENHHGEIFADAKKNEGAEFHIILPTRQPI